MKLIQISVLCVTPVYLLRETNLCGAEASETIVDNLQKHDK